MVARYWGKRFNATQLRDRAGVTSRGATMATLADAGESLGFQARGVRARYEGLLRLELPAIVHWDGDHYIVLYKATSKKVRVADPGLGLRTMTREEFERAWTGFVLELVPTTRLADAPEKGPGLGRFLSYLGPHRGLLAQVAMASIVIELLGLASPVFTQQVVDRVVVTQDRSFLNVLVIGMSLVLVGQVLVSGVRSYLVQYVVSRMDYRMLTAFLTHVLALPMRFFSRHRVGDLMARFSDNKVIRQILTATTLDTLLSSVFGLVYLALMLVYSVKLTLVTLALMPLLVLLSLVAIPIMKRNNRRAFAANAEQSAGLVETLSGVETVKASGAERPMRWNWEGLFAKSVGIQTDAAHVGIGFSLAGSLVQGAGSVVLLWYGATMILDGEMTVGGLMAFQMLVGHVTAPIQKLIGLWPTLQQVSVSLERLGEVLDVEPEERADDPTRIELESVQGAVRFDHVSFRYGGKGSPLVLQGISFRAEPGERIAIVGRSGSGKTTLGRLLQGLQSPTKGRVLLDDIDVSTISKKTLRREIASVLHDPTLFSGTVLENITLWEEMPEMCAVVDAAKLADIHEFVSSLPSGYQTKVGERGTSLSSGQRQRLTLARALYKRPRVLLMDEATSALDYESESNILRNLDALGGMTTLVIAHRLRTVRNADRVLVLDQGRIVEEGTPDELLARDGLFRKLAGGQIEV